jgi:dipeptidase D
MQDSEMIEWIMDEFRGFAKCPRPSLHEKKISDHLVKRLKDLGVEDVKQDEVYNVIANVPATAGYEQVPTTILQGHMDMVCVAKKGVPFDPETSEIKLIREGNILHADGTSLGADDGAGLAAILMILKTKAAHGPLRIIFTTDEETGMTGAGNLNPEYIRDAKYIINCDSESIGSICTGSAGSFRASFTRSLTMEKAAGKAFALKADGFTGGHSGEAIGLGRSNAIQQMAFFLRALREAGISFRLASFEGGDAPNAIPANSQAVIVLSEKDEPAVRSLLKEEMDKFHNMYLGIEDKAEIVMEEADLPGEVWSAEDTDQLINLLTLLHSGTFAMNQEFAGLPELSANIGTIRTKDNSVTLQYMPRSGNDNRLARLRGNLPILASAFGFEISMTKPEPAWVFNPNNHLTDLYSEAFTRVTGGKVKVEAIHGGLETGYFYSLNPHADIISVGPETHHIHSPQESVELDTIVTLTRTIAETLAAMK